MKKTFFIVLYLSVIYMALNGNKVLAVESEPGILYFAVEEEGSVEEEKSVQVSIYVESFNAYIIARVSMVNDVYNTRKVDEDVISFSIEAGGVQHHNIRCRIVYHAQPLQGYTAQGYTAHTLIFYDCGNDTVRFLDNAIDMRVRDPHSD